jgi:signal transduction histidine kinase
VDRPESPLTTALGWRLPRWLLDYGPVAFIALEGIAAIAFKTRGGAPEVLLWLAVLGSALALLRRRRAPVVVLGVVLVIVLALDYGPIVTLPTLLALFTVAEYRDRGTVFVAAALAAVVLIVAHPVHGHTEGAGAILSRLVAVGLAVAAGLYLRARADYVRGLQDRAERLERERELLDRQTAGEERVRIARELHDVVAHNVSLMVVQAQALAATSGGDAEQQAALGRLAGLGREALAEMHRMLGVLRLETGGGAEREPQPGVAELNRLVRRTGEAGLDVSLAIEGEPRLLPSAVDLSAYRIVQEALTNVIRHADAEHVQVVLGYLPNQLLVTVTDDGRGPQPTVNGSAGGHGLVGMRERVALFGGSLQTSSGAAGHGYRVEATLPTSSTLPTS